MPPQKAKAAIASIVPEMLGSDAANDGVNPAELQAAWQKAQSIGAPGVGSHYLPNPDRVDLWDIIASFLGGPRRAPSVAAQDPYGIEAALQGKGPVPALMGTTAPVDEATAALKAAIKAYHGSPHDFERFDLSKIGTGEGAQAYGHGLYFAENENVAGGYRQKLAGKPEVRAGGTPISLDYDIFDKSVDPQHKVASRLSLTFRALRELDPAATSEAATQKVAQDIQSGLTAARASGDKAVANSLERQQVALEAMRSKGIDIAPQGRMYEVQLRVDPASLLDWDKPLTQQTPHVQQALKQVGIQPEDPANIAGGEEYLKGMWQEYEKALHKGDTAAADRIEASISSTTRDLDTMRRYADMTGAQAYEVAGRRMEAAQRLKDVGIPGIKYLDAGSRAAGEGSRNYVIFDDSLIDILKKYGVALPVIGALGRAAQQQGGVLPADVVHEAIGPQQP